MAFQTSIPVRFGDEDRAGVVYFPRFLHFFHCALEDFFSFAGHPYREVLEIDRVGWPAVHADVDFLRPLRFGDVFEIDVWVQRVGNKSATFGYRGRIRGEDHDVAKAAITVACVQLDDFRPIPIPEKYREILERHTAAPAS